MEENVKPVVHVLILDKTKMKKFAKLRRQVEEVLQAQAVDPSEAPVADIYRLIDQLHTHQTELETQNEALRQTRDQLETRLMEQAAKLSAANKSRQKEKTKRKRAEETLRQAHTQLELERKSVRATLDILPLGLSLVDVTGEILIENPTIKEIWAFDKPSE